MADYVRALRRVTTLLSSLGGTESASGGYRSVPNLYLGPPDPALIGNAANRVFSSCYASMRRRYSDLGLLGHLIGGTRASHGELLSFVFFDREFHEVLIDLGRTHAVNTLGPRGS